MWGFMKKSIALGAVAAALNAGGADAIKVTITNMCADEFDLSHVGEGRVISVERFASGSTMVKDLPMESHSRVFKAGTGAQATLAEISVGGGMVYYDVSIIPTGRVGPGFCPNFEACKAVTQGHSFNYPMQMLPSVGPSGRFPTCTTITCMHDGCPEAYLFPKDDDKTRVCSGDTDLTVTFCPGGPGGKTPAPTPPPTTPAPTTPAPTTPEPTTPEPTTLAPAVNESSVLDGGFLGGSGSGNAALGDVGEDRSLDLETPAPTEAPAPTTEAVSVAGAPQPVVQEVTTKSSNEGSTGAGFYVLLSVGAAAMVAGSAIFVIRKKKMALEALDEKTPRPTTARGANAFALSTPTESTIL